MLKTKEFQVISFSSVSGAIMHEDYFDNVLEAIARVVWLKRNSNLLIIQVKQWTELGAYNWVSYEHYENALLEMKDILFLPS